jgi:ABC-type multidrug transport system fused ATPase/permease subunit
MIRTLVGIIRLFTPAERLSGALLFILMIIAAAVELAGIISITPLLAVLGNPQFLHSNSYLRELNMWLGSPDQQSFSMTLTGFTLVILMCVSAFRALILFLQFRFASMRRHQLALRLLCNYIRQPYTFFLDNNSSSLTKVLLSEVDGLVEGAINPALMLLSYGGVILAITILLLFLDPFLATTVPLAFATLYIIFYACIRSYLLNLGTKRLIANEAQYRAAAEILGGVKELKVFGHEQFYLNTFRNPSINFSRRQATEEVLAELPKYIMETIAVATIILIVIYLLERDDFAAAFPIVGVYVFSAYRMLPAMQQVYSSAARLRFATPAVTAILSDLEKTPSTLHNVECVGERLPLGRAITLENVSFLYAGAKTAALRNVSFRIPAVSTTGIIGTTGAGKSTLIDLLLGLLQPVNGQILIDDVPLTAANSRAWQNNIGYVPQHIFLVDDTVARNIALGIEDNNIDEQALDRAARIARIHSFITEELPHGYGTVIGERGARLSGGQRQRLGVARALYHDPDILIFDEATNALDQGTEAELLKRIDELAGQKTIIIVTHRLAAVKHCNQILQLEKGKLAGTALYEVAF